MKDGKNALLNVMDIFIKEPLVDWNKYASRKAKDLAKGSGD